MKIALIGATGTIGRRIAQEALSRGHSVTALVREPAKLDLKHPALVDELEKPRNIRRRMTAAY